MFELVHHSKLVVGNKYKIDDIKVVYIKHKDSIVEYYQINSGYWNRFRYFPIYWPVYRFIPQNPQWKMERRSVNMIVRRLIGDDCFEW